MLRTVEAVIDEQGQVRLLETVQLAGARRALVTILDDEPVDTKADVAQVDHVPLTERNDRMHAYRQTLQLAEALSESGVTAHDLLRTSREKLEARS